MAITPMHPSPRLAAADGVRQVHAVLDRCASVGDLSGYAASSLIVELDRAVTRLQALKLSLVAVVDRSDVASDAGMTGTAAWLAARSRRDGASAAREVRLATALDGGFSATREALSVGDLSTEHALVIATTAQQLPSGLDETERAAIEQSLVAVGKRVDPAALRRKARRALESVHRSQAEVDAHEDSVLRSEEERALAATRLTLHDNHDGTTTGRFTVPTLAGQILKKVIQQIASPRRFAQQAARDARLRAAAQGGSLTADEVAEATWDAFRSEDLDWSQKYGRAFVELLEHLPTDHLSGKVNATVLVTLDHDKLKASLGAAHLDTGHDLSASEARRLACGAGIVPAVLDGESQLLDLGRTQRFFTEAQRVALSMTYDSCAAEDCDRPYAWTEHHHEDPWARGGRTDLDQAVPLCGFHHRRIHHPGFHHRITREAGGRKRVTIHRRR
ncbi:HNH endonuclease signature motif containing protein [Pedococcus bigeumensis]|uniref:HNH endonuclease signature motif containing protein n=1 Tax=Pedococcus bigeumensis TaxID=433644 RepID=UPI002FE74807